MFLILTFIVIGMVAGWAASWLIRGDKNPRDWGLLFMVGVGGSLIGGIIVNLVAGNGFMLRPAGIIGSIAVACLLLWLITRAQNRTRDRKAARQGGRREPKGGAKHHTKHH